MYTTCKTSQASAAQATPVAPGPDARLLLTPALRVVPRAPVESWDDEEDWTEEPMVAELSPSGWSLPEAEPEPAELDAALTLPIQPPSVRSPAPPPTWAKTCATVC